MSESKYGPLFISKPIGEEYKEYSETDHVGLYAGMLSLTEVGVGSLLHALHLPLTGHILSLNQIFLLSRATSQGQKNWSRFSPASISIVAALLKSLAPIGKKITPMVAIGMQGLIFNIGLVFFGKGVLGCIVGGFLSSLWGFLQPFLIYYLIFGEDLFAALLAFGSGIEKYIGVPQNMLLCILVAGVIFKVSAGALLSLLAFKIPTSYFDRYIAYLGSIGKQPSSKKRTGILKGKIGLAALKDLSAPCFVLSVILTAAFSIWMHDSVGATAWQILRPLACGFLFFFALRRLPVDKIIKWLERKNYQRVQSALSQALKHVYPRNFKSWHLDSSENSRG